MRKILVIATIYLFTVSCEYKDLANPCYHGKVIMSSCCSGSTFINIENSIHIGKSTRLNGQNYSNVIQVPGYITDSEIYLAIRKFDPNKDYSLFPPIHCYCLIAEGMDVPLYVASSVSATACPDQINTD